MADVVDSTGHAVRLGDREWVAIFERFHMLARTEVERFRGQLIKTMGDGILATFDGPARATLCAFALRDIARTLGFQLRAGLHTGEIERSQLDVAGIAIHVAARIMTEAGAGEVWTSSTVRDLVSGSGIAFSELGSFDLKGIARPWQLCRAVLT
jgi:class 3 adenylate cyclase